MAAPATFLWDHSVKGLAILTLTFTADGDYPFQIPNIDGMTIEANGTGGNNFGSGTVTLAASNFGIASSSFRTLALYIIAGTAEDTLSAAGLASGGSQAVSFKDLSWGWYNVHLTGSTSPSLKVVIVCRLRNNQ